MANALWHFMASRNPQSSRMNRFQFFFYLKDVVTYLWSEILLLFTIYAFHSLSPTYYSIQIATYMDRKEEHQWTFGVAVELKKYLTNFCVWKIRRHRRRSIICDLDLTALRKYLDSDDVQVSADENITIWEMPLSFAGHIYVWMLIYPYLLALKPTRNQSMPYHENKSTFSLVLANIYLKRKRNNQRKTEIQFVLFIYFINSLESKCHTKKLWHKWFSLILTDSFLWPSNQSCQSMSKEEY